MKHTLKYSFTTFLFLALLTAPFPSQAKRNSQETYTTNKFSFNRPSDRWRILGNQEGDGKIFSYLRHGANINIDVSEKAALNRHFTKRTQRKSIWARQFKKTLEENYIKKGFKIVEFEINPEENLIHTQSVDQNRNYLLMSFKFKNNEFKSDYAVVKTFLENKDYINFRAAHYKVANNIKQP